MDDILKGIAAFSECDIDSQLIHRLTPVKKRGYLSKNEFVDICMWKSARPKQRYLSNSEKDIREITCCAFACSNEKVKILSLTALGGVSIPTASAILTLTDPKNYGVIDTRVWQTLYLYGLVNHNPLGIGIALSDWIQYLDIIRNYAKAYKCDARTVEQVIFRYHQDNLQKGALYR